MRPGTTFLLLLILAAALPGQAPPAKQVAAPPADILTGRVRLPEPASVVQRSRAVLLAVEFAHGPDGRGVFETELPADGERLSLVPIGFDADRWTLETATAGPRGTLAGIAPQLEWQRADLDVVPGATVRARLTAPPGSGGGLLLAAGDGPALLESHLTTHRRVAGEPLGVAARLLGGALDGAALLAETPAGALRVPFARGGDGWWRAELPPLPPGEVFARVVARGVDDAGRALLRGTWHAFSVVAPAALLDGTADARPVDEVRVGLDLGLWAIDPTARLHVSAEVWGTDASGALVPVAWLSRMTAPDAGRVALEFDVRWLAVAGADAPLELRRARLQDPDTHVLFDRLDRVPLGDVPLPAAALAPTGIVPAMLTGTPPGSIGRDLPGVPLAPPPLDPALMLSHGYCSSGMIWPLGDFSEPLLEFVDPNQARSHDEFAQLIAAFGAQKDSFGFVGHSQGGAAALHLLTYYRSGLDLAVGPRRIQSVATPYQGTPLASLGFFACGTVDDLTVDGAALWLAGIPSWARAEVHYWTTQNSGAECNFLASLVLDEPNDGTVEVFRGQLPGANDMGNEIGWCHTTGMTEPPSYTDATRNVEMDAQAAR